MWKSMAVCLLIVFPVAGVDATNGATISDATGLLEKPVATTGTPAVGDSSFTDTTARGSLSGNRATVDSTGKSLIPEKKIDRSATIENEKPSARKITLTKRKYNYKQQIILAVGMMVFVALMMTTAQNWNPK